MQTLTNALIISLIIGCIMALSNYKNWQLQDEYEITTQKSWTTLTMICVLASVALGTLSCWGTLMSSFTSEAYYFTIIGAVVGYAGVMSIYTDIPLYKVDRYMLRIGYVIVLVTSLTYALTQYAATLQLYTLYMIAFVYVALFILFLFSGVGASDIRALSIILPFLFVAHVTVGVVTFIVAIIFVSIVVHRWQRKAKEKIPVPILPYIFLPYFFILPTYGIILNAWQEYWFTH